MKAHVFDQLEKGPLLVMMRKKILENINWVPWLSCVNNLGPVPAARSRY